jgi:hypothetical protein
MTKPGFHQSFHETRCQIHIESNSVDYHIGALGKVRAEQEQFASDSAPLYFAPEQT